jgi:hypothetical protein
MDLKLEHDNTLTISWLYLESLTVRLSCEQDIAADGGGGVANEERGVEQQQHVDK